MGDIKKFSLVKNSYSQDFFDECNNVIHNYQTQNLTVEIQYSTIFDTASEMNYYSAMIFGREK